MILLFGLVLVLLVLQVESQDDRHDQTSNFYNFNDSSPVFHLDPKFPPISVEDIIRGLSPHGYRGDAKRMHHVLKKAVQRKSLRLVVLGGSVPFGVGLEPNAYRDCWPTQLMHMLKTIFNIKVSMNNLSIRAVSSDAQATGHFKYLM